MDDTTSTSELGTTSGIAPAPWGLALPGDTSTGFVVEPLEQNPDLRFPLSAPVFDRMRRTDAQIAANLRAVTQTIHSATWDLTGATDVPADVIEFVRSEIGLLDPTDTRARRRRHGIVFSEHLRDALLMLPIGFAVFEQVYAYGEDGLFHLRKLATRPATTLEEIRVGRDGGLEGVVQAAPPMRPTDRSQLRPVFIPVEHLVWYVHEKEGADWTGQSIIRAAYKAWFIKEQLERLSAQIAERNGMGIPVATVSETLSPDARKMLEDAMAAFRAGSKAFAVFPEGVAFDVKGVAGGTVDVLPMINHFDQQISKSMQAMFMDLGHDNGARSLGETLREAFLVSCQSVADNIAATFTEHVIRDLVEINYGEDTPYPLLTATGITPAPGAPMTEPTPTG